MMGMTILEITYALFLNLKYSKVSLIAVSLIGVSLSEEFTLYENIFVTMFQLYAV